MAGYPRYPVVPVPSAGSTDLQAALEYLGRVVRRRSVAFVISDFLDDDFGDALMVTSRRHDVTAISVTDPREVALPTVGLLELEDAETGEIMIIDTYDRNVTRGFATLTDGDRKRRTELFRGAGVGEIDIRTDASYVDPIVRHFRAREHSHR